VSRSCTVVGAGLALVTTSSCIRAPSVRGGSVRACHGERPVHAAIQPDGGRGRRGTCRAFVAGLRSAPLRSSVWPAPRVAGQQNATTVVGGAQCVTRMGGPTGRGGRLGSAEGGHYEPTFT
jgi:hypothetical protein